MYVCICKAVTDSQINRAISDGASTRRELTRCTGAGAICGKCSPCLKSLLDDNLRQKNGLRSA